MARAARLYEHSVPSYEQMIDRNEFTLYVDAADTVLSDTHDQPITAAHAVPLRHILCSAVSKSMARKRGGAGGVAGAVQNVFAQMDAWSCEQLKCGGDTLKAVGADLLGCSLQQLLRPRDGECGVIARGTPHERYSAGARFCIQAGPQCTAGHVEFTRAITCMPRCCPHAVKLWVVRSDPGKFDSTLVWDHVGSHEDAFARSAANPDAAVVVVLPGDVIVQPPMVWHAVLTRYRPSTVPGDQWALVGGVDITRKTVEDAHAALRWARSASGQRRISRSTSDAEAFEDDVLRAHWELWGHGSGGGVFTPESALRAMRDWLGCKSDQYAQTAAACQAGNAKKKSKRAAARARGRASGAKRRAANHTAQTAPAARAH